MRSVPSAARFWLVTLASAMGIGITAALGVWQLSRAAEKTALQDTMDTQARLPPMGGAVLALPDVATTHLYRPVVLQGRWLVRHTVYLDNRQMDGRPGFFVLTPLLLESSGAAVLVQRGWAPRNFVDRSRLPEVQTPAGPVEVRGRIAPPPAKLYEFGVSPPGAIRQNLDLQQFSAEIGLPLAPVSVMESGPPSDGLRRDWPAVHLGVEKHYGYAFQWFALGGLMALLYGWFQIVKPFLRSR